MREYKCGECSKRNKKGAVICEFCFGKAETIEIREKKENKMTKDMAIKFLKNQSFMAKKFGKQIEKAKKFSDIADLIAKGIPSDDQGNLF